MQSPPSQRCSHLRAKDAVASLPSPLMDKRNLFTFLLSLLHMQCRGGQARRQRASLGLCPSTSLLREATRPSSRWIRVSTIPVPSACALDRHCSLTVDCCCTPCSFSLLSTCMVASSGSLRSRSRCQRKLSPRLQLDSNILRLRRESSLTRLKVGRPRLFASQGSDDFCVLLPAWAL